MRQDVKFTIVMLVTVCVAAPGMPLHARPFGLFFPAPHQRVQRRHVPAPVAAPLPVPRPHFATVPSPAGARAEKQAKPVAVDASPQLSPPSNLSPFKPAQPETSGPAKPAAGPPVPTPSSPAPAAPVPDKPSVSEGRKADVSPAEASQAFTPRAPTDDPTCHGRLAARHVAAKSIAIGKQPDARCTVVEAVTLASLVLPDGATVDFPDHPTIACTTADAFSLYVRDLLVPLAKGTFGSPVASVWTGPGLECRSRDHIFGAKLSAHGQGLAIDIAQLELADGRMVEVGAPKTDAETGFETASRAAACGYFHTVLGPGSDSYHRTHWHFDLEVRGSGGDGKYCK